MVVTDGIAEEWGRNASRWARTWRLSMIARKRVDRAVPPSLGDLYARVCKSLEQMSGANAEDAEGALAAVEKDWHLVEAALHTDRVIASDDRVVRRHLATIATASIGALRHIVWVNPLTDDSDDLREWLCSGAPVDTHRVLGFVPLP